MIQVFNCTASDMSPWLYPGYMPIGCPLCGWLWCEEGPGASFRGAICDFTEDELDEVQESLRDEAGRPDADHFEVAIMLDDPGIVVFVDPFTLEEEGSIPLWQLN